MKPSAIFNYQASFPFSGEKPTNLLHRSFAQVCYCSQQCSSERQLWRALSAIQRGLPIQLQLPSSRKRFLCPPCFPCPGPWEYKGPKAWIKWSPWRQWAGKEKASVILSEWFDGWHGLLSLQSLRGRKKPGISRCCYRALSYSRRRQEHPQQSQPQTGKVKLGAMAGGPAHAGCKRTTWHWGPWSHGHQHRRRQPSHGSYNRVPRLPMSFHKLSFHMSLNKPGKATHMLKPSFGCLFILLTQTWLHT